MVVWLILVYSLLIVVFIYVGKYCFVRLNIDKNVCIEIRIDLYVENKVCGVLDLRIYNSNNRIFI